ncbi:MAG: hypothetical protein J6B92_02055, partial [Paraprevotella sp.]|nr:hypothetical protein [Paraprevotella sp.]
MDLKQIVRAAVNRWRNKSFSPNGTASEPTSARTEVTVSTKSPATIVVTLTVAGADEAPRVFTVTASSFSISYQGNTMFINIQADTYTEMHASSETSLPLETQASREEKTVPDVPVSTEATTIQEPLETKEEKAGVVSEAPTTSESPAKENTPARMNADIQSFLDRTSELRFNVLTECTECRLKGEDSFHPLTERIRNMLCVQAQDAGISCWDRDLNRLIESARVPDYHPFRGYFAALPTWDGRDRLTDLAARVSTDEKWIRHFHRWMLGLA